MCCFSLATQQWQHRPTKSERSLVFPFTLTHLKIRPCSQESHVSCCFSSTPQQKLNRRAYSPKIPHSCCRYRSPQNFDSSFSESETICFFLADCQPFCLCDRYKGHNMQHLEHLSNLRSLECQTRCSSLNLRHSLCCRTRIWLYWLRVTSKCWKASVTARNKEIFRYCVYSEPICTSYQQDLSIGVTRSDEYSKKQWSVWATRRFLSADSFAPSNAAQFRKIISAQESFHRSACKRRWENSLITTIRNARATI